MLLLVSTACAAQIVTGVITGRVVDSSKAAIVEAEAVLEHSSSGRVRTVNTDASGEFVVGGLEAGDYQIAFTKQGFKRLARSNVRLESGQRLVLGEVVLEIGAVSDSVNVTAEMGAAVATQSADRSDLITGRQIEGLLNLGRNVTSYVQLMPGVVVARESNSLGRTTDFHVNGSRRTMNSVAIDGLPATDVGNAFDLKLNVSQDSVAEVKVLLSNYQAEYGRAAGGNVVIVTKSGTKQYHGLLSYYKRHEQFNANNFFNNLNGQARPRYRFNAWTYNIGGPVYLPKLTDRQKSKLFFFWGQESWPTKRGFTGNVTVPTALERAGDYSDSRDLNNALIVVRDPQSNAPFPGNRIPANRLSADGRALLNVFPAANFFDRNISRGNYNYNFQTDAELPIRTDTLKLDYLFNEKNSVVFAYNGFYENQTGTPGFGQPAAGGINWPQWNYKFQARTQGFTGRYTRVFTPSLLNEFHLGWLHHPEQQIYEDETVARNSRQGAGYRGGQFYPDINPLGLLPSATFGGVTTPAVLGLDGRFPLRGLNNLINVDNKLSWNKGRHGIKAGVYYEWFQRDIGESTNFSGAFDFGRNVNNPLDTGYAYSNAALGVFNSYSESSGKPYVESRNKLLELFVQDNWRVNSRLTLDYGLRLHFMPMIVEKEDRIASFVPSRFSSQSQVKLIQPGFNASGTRVGVNPNNGQFYPASLIGAIAPGAGNAANGMVVPGQDGSIPRSISENPGMRFGPRVGFAYDVFGNGKTAIRSGFGMFFNRPNFGTWLRPYAAQPPLVQTPVINFGTMDGLLSGSGLLSPNNVLGLDGSAKVPRVMNFSFSVQQNVGFGTVVDVGYVGSLARNLLWTRPLNAIPFGANFDSRNFDPTLPGRPLPPQFLRPTVGYLNINYRETAASSNYHSMQVSVNRRFQKGLQMGGSYTWSKAMDYNDEDGATISALVPVREWDYGLAAFDRTHNLKINFLYDLPSPQSPNYVSRFLVAGWQVSGIASFTSGRPLSVGFTTTTAVDITGSPTDNARVLVVGQGPIASGDRTFARNFNTEAFALPARGTYGSSSRTHLRGPGVANWDLAVFKRFAVTERFGLQFRCELYNAFNHTQFSGWDTTARFSPTGVQSNPRFGQAISALDARIMQLSLRAQF